MRCCRLVCILSAMLLIFGVAFAQNDYENLQNYLRVKAETALSLDDLTPNFIVTLPADLPYNNSTTLVGAVDDCGHRHNASLQYPDHIYEIRVRQLGQYTFKTCNTTAPTDTRLYLDSLSCVLPFVTNNNGCSANSLTDIISCVALGPGVYYLVVETNVANGAGPYTLTIEQCPDSCDIAREAFPEGQTHLEGSHWVFAQTVDDESPLYEGPWELAQNCNPAETTRGFGYWCWFNGDFGWRHLWDGHNQGDYNGLTCVDSVVVQICAYDVDHDICLAQHPSDPNFCEHDRLWVDESQPTPTDLNGNVRSFSLTSFHIPVSALDNGELDCWMDFDATHNSCFWKAIVNWSRMVVYYRIGLPNCDSGELVGYDYGDLDPGAAAPCYATYDTSNNGPANPIWQNNLAWLGESVNSELAPQIIDNDIFDDGVHFFQENLMPCTEESVRVTISTGPGYRGEPLFLYGYKDGNLNCSFLDTLWCNHTANSDDFAVLLVPECFLRAGIPPMQANESRDFVFHFIDPGVTNFGHYDGILRFRLLSQDPGCEYAYWTIDPTLGETEDYIWDDLQLAVELNSFDATMDGEAVKLVWSTASETNNDHFEIERQGSGAWQRIAGNIAGAGSSTTSRNYSYFDRHVVNGNTYHYRLISVDINGTRQEAAQAEIAVLFSDPATVADYALYSNYPNPFNPSTVITYDLKADGHVSLQVFDIMGRTIATLVNRYQGAGRYRVTFQARDLPSGVYFYRLEAGNFSAMNKMILLK